MERTRKHPLITIVFMTVCGVLSGANSIAGIHEFAIDRRSWLARDIDLSSDIPSEDTFGRVLARLDPAAFEKCLLGWIRDVVAAPDEVDPEGQWRDLSAVGIAISERVESNGRASHEVRYYILSRRITAQEFAGAVRGHWGIENNLHWRLDESFREEECRACRDHAPANLSVARRIALGLLKRETECKKGIEIKRIKCAASDEYRNKVLFKCGT